MGFSSFLCVFCSTNWKYLLIFWGESIIYCHIFVTYQYSEATLAMYLIILCGLFCLFSLSQILGQSALFGRFCLNDNRSLDFCKRFALCFIVSKQSLSFTTAWTHHSLWSKEGLLLTTSCKKKSIRKLLFDISFTIHRWEIDFFFSFLRNLVFFKDVFLNKCEQLLIF